MRTDCRKTKTTIAYEVMKTPPESLKVHKDVVDRAGEHQEESDQHQERPVPAGNERADDPYDDEKTLAEEEDLVVEMRRHDERDRRHDHEGAERRGDHDDGREQEPEAAPGETGVKSTGRSRAPRCTPWRTPRRSVYGIPGRRRIDGGAAPR